VLIAKRLEDSMQQAQEYKVVVESAEAAQEVEQMTPEQQAPVQLDVELLRLVGGGNTSSPRAGW
jgi:hypothetical protein